MAGIMFFRLKSLVGSVNCYSRTLPTRFRSRIMSSAKVGDHFHVRATVGFVGQSYHTDNYIRVVNFESRASAQFCKPNFGLGLKPALLNSHCQSGFGLLKMSPVSGCLSYSSFAGGKGDGNKGSEVVEASGSGGGDVSGGVGGGGVGGEWVDRLKDGWQSVVDAATVAVHKGKDASDQLTPQVQQVLDAHPYLRDVLVPVGGTMTATLLAWVALPRFLKKLHRYSEKGSAALLSGTGFAVDVPYEKSVWVAMEDPVRYLMTFLALSQVCFMVAPDHVVSQFVGQAWKGAVILSFIWFLQRWKTNFVARTLALQDKKVIDRDLLLTLDKVSTVGLLAVGVVAVAEACGVAVQSILTVGGIGGVATAFAAKDILGNVLSGLSMQFTKPFSLGDTIKAGSVEGQVVEMGLTTTSLLNYDKFPVIVPNSTFSSQVIVNKSRAAWRAFDRKIPLQFENLEKIPQVADDIKSMLNSYPNVFLERETPYCYLSRIETSYAELTVGCNLKSLTRQERYSTEQDILLQSIQIIKQYGLILGSVQQDFANQ